MTKFIWSVQDAIRSRLTFVVECVECDRDAFIQPSDFSTWKNLGRDPWSLKFRCKTCQHLGKLLVMLPAMDVRPYRDKRDEDRSRRQRRMGGQQSALRLG